MVGKGERKLEYRAIIHSFHSHVYNTYRELDEFPSLILSLDSHVDTRLHNLVDLMPEEIWYAALRASALTFNPRAFGELPLFIDPEDEDSFLAPEMCLAVPRVSWGSEIMNLYYDKYAVLEDKLRYNRRAFEKEYRRSIKNFYGIKIYESPPNNLLKLVKKLNKADYPILDIDVDYMGTMQSECYTPFKNVRLKDLGDIDKVISLIRKSKPPIITISEAKLSAINDANSNFSRMMDRIRNLGYEVEFSTMLDSDEEAMRLISIHENFVKEIQNPFKEKYGIHQLLGDYPHKEELSRKAKKYFRTIKKQS